MNTFKRISVIASTTCLVAACSTQQVVQDAPVAQNTPQSQVSSTAAVANKPVVLPMPSNTTVVTKPAPRVVQASVQPKKVVVQKKIAPKLERENSVFLPFSENAINNLKKYFQIIVEQF